MKKLVSLTVASLTLAAATASADNDPVVVELFTSQSCYSCPPAEKLLGELAQRKDVLALEFHVDYWDDLVFGEAGRWKDVFSKRAHTERQVGYNRRIRGKSNVYTPQMVVGGQLEAVGSYRADVLSAIDAAAEARKDRVRVEVALDPKINVKLAGDSVERGGVWLVRFIERHRTEVRAGENKDKSLVNHHVVTEVRRIGEWTGRSMSVTVPNFALAAGEGCAVLVQDNRQGPILGAGACPTL